MVRLRGWLLLLALASAGCGYAPDAQREWERSRVNWWVSDDRQTAWCSSRGDERIMPIEDFPSGYYCHWSCAWYDGRLRQVYLDVDVEETPDGLRFVPADRMRVYDGGCRDDELDCPTCNFD